VAKKSGSPKKPINYKFSAGGRDGVSVKFSGLFVDEEAGEGEDLPKELLQVLNEYGFDYDSEDLWVDCIGPQGDGLGDELEALAGTVAVTLTAKPVGKGGKRRIDYVCNIGGSTGGDKNVSVALEKAFKAWNKDGRPVVGVKFETAMNRVLQKVNAKRG
jgi:hypothetical protein